MLFLFLSSYFLVRMLTWPRLCFKEGAIFDLQQFILQRCFPVISVFLTVMVDSNQHFLRMQKAENTVIILHWEFSVCSKSYSRITLVTASTEECEEIERKV